MSMFYLLDNVEWERPLSFIDSLTKHLPTLTSTQPAHVDFVQRLKEFRGRVVNVKHWDNLEGKSEEVFHGRFHGIFVHYDVRDLSSLKRIPP